MGVATSSKCVMWVKPRAGERERVIKNGGGWRCKKVVLSKVKAIRGKAYIPQEEIVLEALCCPLRQGGGSR